MLKVVIGIGFGIAALLIFQSLNKPGPDPFAGLPPGFRETMKKASEDAAKDFDGPLGDRAYATCKNRLGVTARGKTMLELLRQNVPTEKIEALLECVGDEMYPSTRRAK
jgi:hypothetical protein